MWKINARKTPQKNTEKGAEEDEAAATGDEGAKKEKNSPQQEGPNTKTAPEQPQKKTQMKQ